jgi:hypothetical protein
MMNDHGFPFTRELLVGLALATPLLLIPALILGLIAG